MNYVPFLVFAAIIVAMLVLSGRNKRRRALAEIERAEQINVGTDVMTTSGLYATVVAKNDDGSVQLSISPGVEVRWEFAALRDVASLPGRSAPGAAAGDADDPRGAVDLGKSDKRSGSDPTS